jgi:hypothetical protein
MYGQNPYQTNICTVIFRFYFSANVYEYVVLSISTKFTFILLIYDNSGSVIPKSKTKLFNLIQIRQLTDKRLRHKRCKSTCKSFCE